MEDNDTAAPPEVVVGTDGTATALRAVAWAATEARVRGLPLLIVHAAPYATADYPAGRRRAAAILGRAYTVAHQREPNVPTRTERSGDAPVTALAHASRRAELLVVGMLGGHVGDDLVASIAPAVSAVTQCPVTVVRSDHRPAGSRLPVVVGLEDVVADAAALTVAFADAARHGSSLVVVHARHTTSAEPEATLLHELEPWRDRRPAVRVEARVVPGAAGDALLHASIGARLLVVGASGRNLAARAVLGSTSRTLVRHGSCPVTVVRRDVDAAETPDSAHEAARS